VNNERLIAIFFALLVVVGAWRGYEYLTRPDFAATALDPSSGLDPPRARDEPIPGSPSIAEDAPAETKSGSVQGGEQQNIYRCLKDGDVVLASKPCTPGAEEGNATPVLGRDRSDRPKRSDERSAARDRPETECERIDRQIAGLDGELQRGGASADNEDALKRRTSLNQDRVARGCAPHAQSR
jgi:hypothetical protein